MYKKLAEKIAEGIEEKGAAKAATSVYRYGAEMLLSSLGGILTVIFLGIVFQNLLAGLVYYSSYALMRSSSGGYHATTQLKCYFLSLFCVLAFYILMAVIPQEAFFLSSIACAPLSAVCILILAPVGTPNKPLDDTEKKVYGRRSRWILLAEAAAIVILLILRLDAYAFMITVALFTVAMFLIAGNVAIKKQPSFF